MDLLTQGLLGSAVAQTTARPDDIRKAGLIGFLSGLAADLDFFIHSSSDPLLNLEFHRHFTHSVFFIPFAALLLSLLFWPFFRKSLTLGKIYVFSFFGYLLSGFLDACTSYGTRLLWPISEDRFSFNIISIIDPVFSLLLIAGILISLKKKHRVFVSIFLVLAASYMLSGFYQKSRVMQVSQELISQQGHHAERLLVKPTLGNLWLWRSVYQYENHYYINAIRLNPFSGEARIFPGKTIEVFNSDQNRLDIPKDSVLQNDIERFAHFSDHYLAFHPQKPDVLIDVRYANLPNNLTPLWGIEFDATASDQHAEFRITRDKSLQTRQAFIDMLLNRNE